MKLIGQFLFWLIGWKLVGSYPGNDNSFVIIVAPHTSNWDVPIGLCVKFWQNMKVKFYVKSELFFPPLSWLLRALGALPIVRSRSTNFVSQAIDDFKTKKNHRILITPEGTRRKVEKFKTGFYHIADGAGVPILPVIFDYEKKQVILKEFYFTTGDAERDISEIESMYEGIKGKYLENSFTRT
jgi:1-acyl-sn-glycerol-3-phosphate acyltransferase